MTKKQLKSEIKTTIKTLKNIKTELTTNIKRWEQYTETTKAVLKRKDGTYNISTLRVLRQREEKIKKAKSVVEEIDKTLLTLTEAYDNWYVEKAEDPNADIDSYLQ